jgi:hypothetical protein
MQPCVPSFGVSESISQIAAKETIVFHKRVGRPVADRRYERALETVAEEGTPSAEGVVAVRQAMSLQKP